MINNMKSSTVFIPVSRQTGIVLLREPHSVSGERVHQRELAAGAPEEEPVRHGAVADGVLRHGHAVDFAAWDAEEGAVGEVQPREWRGQGLLPSSAAPRAADCSKPNAVS